MQLDGDPGLSVDTHCPYCALQCGMRLLQRGESWEVEARDFPTNRGALCRKGWTAGELLTSRERLTTPLLRPSKGAALAPASWDEAIALIGGALARVQREHGRAAVGLFGGGGLTNETAYMLGKFARVVLRTPNIDYNGRFCMASAALANQKAFGLDRGMPFPIADLANTDLVLLIGANPAETMPPLMQYFEALRKRGGRTSVIDPRRTPTAEQATLHLQLTPGSDAALGNGLVHVLIRDRLIDVAFIEARTRGFEAVKQRVASYWPDRVERITGVPARSIVEAAHLFAAAPNAITLTARGPEQQRQGVDNTLSFINLALAAGKAGKPLCGFGTLTGQGNGQGGREHGQKCDQLPGYRKLSEPADREHIAAFWGVDEAALPAPGLPALELFDRLGAPSGVHALIVLGSNPLVSAPDAGTLRDKLARLELLVVGDLFLSETAALADVVLPVTQWAEHSGTTTNLEGRVIYRARVKAPPPEVKTDLEILKLMAAELGAPQAILEAPEAAFDELCRASAGGKADYAGLSHARLVAEPGVFWPCPSDDHPGTPGLFVERFATDDGRARFHAVDHIGPAEDVDELYPFYLTTGRVLAQYQSGTQTRRVESLRAAEPEPFVEIHPQLAATLKLADRDWVLLRTRRGSVTVRARLSGATRYDTLFFPFHWGGANILTNPAVDPTSKIPEFKVCAVSVARAGG